MAQTAAPPPFAAIVVAAGEGLRAGQPLPKQFANWRGKPLLRHSVEALLNFGAAPVVIAIPENSEDIANRSLRGLTGYSLITGGATRQESVLAGLEEVKKANTAHVLIHDAARPRLSREVMERLLIALNDAPGAIPVLPVIDSIAVDEDGFMVGSPDRSNLRRVQTPQAFRFAEILAAHLAWQGIKNAGDDAQVLRADGGQVVLVPGDEALKKVTFAEDFVNDTPAIRTGMGYDVHRLAHGEELWLGGVKIEYDKGLAGHSDADVALHAIVDALLGAIAKGDIGTHFPPIDPQWKGAPSPLFVEHAARLVAEAGYSIGNVDLTIVCEAPQIGPHRDAICKRIAGLLQCEVDRVSVKATTTERLGFTGRGEGIAAQAIATLNRTET